MYWLLGALLGVQEPLSCDLHLYRYWRPPETTSVVGFLTVPLAGLTFVPDSDRSTQTAAYHVEITFRDAAGTVLHRERSTEHVTILFGRPLAGAEAISNLAFDLHRGGYELHVAVTDSVTGVRAEAQEALLATGERPLVGDLLLATTVRRLAHDETPPQGALVRGGTVITPSLHAVVPAEEPTITLYTEVYPAPEQADSAAAVRVVLRGRDGALRQESRALLRRYPVGGGMELLQFPLTDLAPGEYSIGVRVEYPDTAVLVERPFTLQPPVAQAARRPTEPPNPFGDWGELALDSLFQVAEYVATGREKDFYPTLPLDAKRRFMHQFWLRRDPIPGPPNEFYEGYSQRVAYANREFQQRGTPGRGWSSPRGRIHILYGSPAERIVQQVVGRAGFDRPLEIWKYVGGRGDKYVFYDVSGNGIYHLLYTTNPDEPSMPNWQDFFDPETIEFIKRF